MMLILESIPHHDEGLVSTVRVLGIGDHVTGTDEEISLHEIQTRRRVAIGASTRGIINARSEHPTVLERLHGVFDAAECARSITQRHTVMRLERAARETELAVHQRHSLIRDVAIVDHFAVQRLNELIPDVKLEVGRLGAYLK